MSTIEAVRVLRKVGFDIKGAMDQVRVIRQLAEDGTLLPGNVLLAGPTGAVALAVVYTALGVGCGRGA